MAESLIWARSRGEIWGGLALIFLQKMIEIVLRSSALMNASRWTPAAATTAKSTMLPVRISLRGWRAPGSKDNQRTAFGSQTNLKKHTPFTTEQAQAELLPDTLLIWCNTEKCAVHVILSFSSFPCQQAEFACWLVLLVVCLQKFCWGRFEESSVFSPNWHLQSWV